MASSSPYSSGGEEEAVVVLAIAAAAAEHGSRSRGPYREYQRRVSRRQRVLFGTRPARKTKLYDKTPFDLDRFDPNDCEDLFRFSAEEIRAILPFLRLERARYRYGNCPTPEHAFCVFLARLKYTNRVGDVSKALGCSQAYVAAVFADVVDHLTRRFKSFLEWDERRLTRDVLRRYADAIDLPDAAGVPCIWGFIDGTTVTIARPSRHDQRLVYSGHKNKHCIKFQAVVTPDGLCSSLYGPTLGKDGDWKLFRDSGLDARLRRVLGGGQAGVEPPDLYIFGDSAYHGGYGIFGAFSRPPRGELTPEQAAFNVRMSPKRIAVKNFFAWLTNIWSVIEMKRAMRLGSTAVGSIYIAAVLMANCMTCLRGNQISGRFECSPPPLEEYLASFTS